VEGLLSLLLLLLVVTPVVVLLRQGILKNTPPDEVLD